MTTNRFRKREKADGEASRRSCAAQGQQTAADDSSRSSSAHANPNHRKKRGQA